MRPLHFTALSSRSGAPPHHPHYLHHNAMRTIQVDLLLKMEKVLQLQLTHWWTPNPMKTPLFTNHSTKKEKFLVYQQANRGIIRDTWTYENH